MGHSVESPREVTWCPKTIKNGDHRRSKSGFRVNSFLPTPSSVADDGEEL